MFGKSCVCAVFIIRGLGTKVRIVAELCEPVYKDIENNIIKPRHHPGVVKSNVRSLPQQLDNAILHVIGDTPLKQLVQAGKQMSTYLQMRQPPVEEHHLQEKRSSILQQVEASYNLKKEECSEEERKHYEQVVRSKVNNILKQRVYNWTSIEYGHYQSLVYLIAKSTSEYAVLSHVFTQLKASQPHFSPHSLFDFGSGVGTVIWAAESLWPGSIKEYLCVDTSSHINQLSSQILEKSAFNLSHRVFHRQFLPASYQNQFDVVVSAYSLMELPSTSARLQTLHNLWSKTKKYLVLVERGTSAYFNLLNEAREFILMNSRDKDTGEQGAHILAPCSHEFSCPRVARDHTPCNFTVQFSDKYNRGQLTDELFTYIIFAKGEREEGEVQWPRIVRPVLLRSRHAVCKLCTTCGRLDNITFSPTKPNRSTYRCAKASRWGDLLPVDIKYITQTDKVS